MRVRGKDCNGCRDCEKGTGGGWNPNREETSLQSDLTSGAHFTLRKVNESL